MTNTNRKNRRWGSGGFAGRAAAGDLRVDAHGRLHAAALEAVADPETLQYLRRRCPLILEVMAWQSGIAAAYTHISGGGAHIDGLTATFAAALTVYGHSGFGQEVAQPVLARGLPTSNANPHRLIASLTPPLTGWLGEQTTLEVGRTGPIHGRRHPGRRGDCEAGVVIGGDGRPVRPARHRPAAA